MSESQHVSDEQWVQRIASLASDDTTAATVAVAESLTAGRLSAALGRGEDASTWYRGALVAYASEVKHDVLGVDPGPVVSDTCARQMAEGVRRLLGADVGLGITGVGGPGSQEGRPPGTVHLAIADRRGTRAHEVLFDGDPDEVVASATSLALLELAKALEPDEPGGTHDASEQGYVGA
jgi:nicotinamide-nucleotide amidase